MVILQSWYRMFDICWNVDRNVSYTLIQEQWRGKAKQQEFMRFFFRKTAALLCFYSIEEFCSNFPLSDLYCWSWQQLSLTLWFVSNRSSHPSLMRLRSHTPRSFSDAGGMTDGKLAHAHYTHTRCTHTYLRERECVFFLCFFFSVDVRRQCTASPIALTSLHSQSNVNTGMQAPHFTADRKKKKKTLRRHSRLFHV